MRNSFTTLLLAFLVYSCNSSVTKSNPAESPYQERDFKVDLHYDKKKADHSIDTFFRHLHEHRGFNGVVLVAKKGKIVYENAFGYANYLKRDSLTLDSRFQLASISKQFTSMAILLLKQDGKLKLGQPVADFFPNFPYKSITIHHLLTHRSGLLKYENYSQFNWKDKHKAMTNLDLMNLLEQNKPLPWSKPDAHFKYNNINYAILAALVEKISGMPLSQFLKKRVFNPLGMTHTLVYSKATDTLYPTNLIGYEKTFRRRDDPNWLDGVVGDKGVFTTVQDMFIWDQYLYTNKLISQDSLKIAFYPYSRDKKHFYYGYGWRLFYPTDPALDSLKKESPGKIVYHTGWWHGYKNIFVRDIQHHTTIIILSNIFNSSINELDPLYSLLKMPVIRQGAY